jgi:hypothetical protein
MSVDWNARWEAHIAALADDMMCFPCTVCHTGSLTCACARREWINAEKQRPRWNASAAGTVTRGP